VVLTLFNNVSQVFRGAGRNSFTTIILKSTGLIGRTLSYCLSAEFWLVANSLERGKRALVTSNREGTECLRASFKNMVLFYFVMGSFFFGQSKPPFISGRTLMFDHPAASAKCRKEPPYIDDYCRIHELVEGLIHVFH
jgi:hypothetical protein